MTCTTMAVLCGGKGTRLGKLTEHTPKALVEVAGRPFLEWPLEHWAEQGISKVVLCVGHLHDAIMAHFGKTFAGMELVYSLDGEGNGVSYALGRARPFLGTCYWWTYGDTYLPIALEEPARASYWRIWLTENEPIDYGLYYEKDRQARWPIDVEYEDRFHEINTPESLAETDSYLTARLRAGVQSHSTGTRLVTSRSLPDHPA